MKILIRVLLVIACCCVLIIGITRRSATQTETIIFEGYPTIRVVLNGKDKKGNPTPCATEKIGLRELEEYKCVIVKRGNKYYWKSRENKELIKGGAGMYVTFFGVGGNGDHITLTLPAFSRLMEQDITVIKYVEHITHGVQSINYMGSIISYKRL